MHPYSPHAIKAGRYTAQNGSILTMAAIVLSTAVILLASIDIGFLFYQKRELQKIADMAAISGAQQLVKSIKLGGDCHAEAIQIATKNAQIAHGTSATLDIKAGKWLSQTSIISNANCSDSNAIQVDIDRTFGSFFGMWAGQRVYARAIATGTSSSPTAVFSVGSRLLRINDNGVVPLLLKQIGVNASTVDALSYKGIANTRISTSGLLKALGFNIPLNAEAGTLHTLLETGAPNCNANSCTLAAILNALSGKVADQTDLITLLDLNGLQLDTQIKLLSDANGRGLLTFLETANGSSALQADITLGELLNTALLVASSEHAISLPSPGLNLNLGALANITTQLGIVEPPSIGIGKEDTTAYTGQVRLYTRVKADAALVQADLPIAIDLVNGKGTLISLCEVKNAEGQDTATIHVSAPILKTCIGAIADSSFFSRAISCEENLQLPPHPLLKILGNTLQVNSSFHVDGLKNEATLTLTKGETKTIERNDLQLGSTLTTIYKTVLAELIGKLFVQGQGAITQNNLASNLLTTGNNVLNNTVNNLKQTLAQLSNFLNTINTSNGFPDSPLTTLLSGIGNLTNGLLDSVGTIADSVLCTAGAILGTPFNQCMMASELSGSAQGVSKVMLTLLGLVTQLLEPILNAIGNQLSQQLDTLLGLKLGQVDVTLIDLQCGGESNVRLVY
ncbi:pilus assembly protein TadG-related protein [uncultured Oxalicibacterium sp.]|uniref:pilus assembly protein TadG-related protein n=1 Tax=uncultured Oxalicibacterium sp. TaxID=1168540 RepID=UPI0025EE8344|nr:pilus assembly protein TadG-related protein [uncultured Oxalicibacterium sp.]